ncbi:2Fe-2S iron-sulfur cluster-binding protein [Halobacteriovorax sp. HLS]|uniref:2Fe-2S iron-sulfur cluster-binding protein n=1 Tax=Halobacteriovorax sp. HLS TaxID=2234000 RepID=UPI000FD6E996|nr:2Fe-2S iron-sulfur cluster binding domain-containing protein [Halobacteriovorax sp. HLS]
MYKVTLEPTGKVIEVNKEESLLTALREAGVYVKSSCGGHATCSDCIVKVLVGVDEVTPPEFDELQLIGNVFHITKERLACQTKLTGDITIDLSAHDKSSDEQKLKAKTSAFSASKSKPKAVRVRSKEQVEEIKNERQEKYLAKQTTDDGWHKHWEKDSEGNPKKKLGGGKRPREFRTDHIDHERDAKLREEARVRREAREKSPEAIAKREPKTFNESYADKNSAPKEVKDRKKFRK